MRKSIIAIVMCVVMAFFAVLPAYAAEIAGIDTSALPEISVDVSGAGNLDAGKITATLDGKPLTVSGVENAEIQINLDK